MPTARQLLDRRLANQRLTRPEAWSPHEIVAWLGAVQSQDYAGARWALGLRAPTLTDADVERAFDAGDILRTHVLRPTWHFVVPEDLRWMQALTGPRVIRICASHDRMLGLTPAHHRKAAAIFARELEGRRFRTRVELGQALAENGLPSTGQALQTLVMEAELRAEICSGPRRGKQFTYALVDDRVRPTPPLDRDDMLGRLALRYFASHGPATVRDMSWWSGLTMADVSRGVEVAGPALVREVVDGLTYISARDAIPPPRRQPRAWLLPNYDEFLIAFRDRGLSVQQGTPWAADPRAMLAHQLLVDGIVAGSWGRLETRTGMTATVRARPPLDAARRRHLASHAEAFTRFLGRPVTVLFDDPA